MLKKIHSPKEAIDREAKERLKGIFESAAARRVKLRKRNWYYYKELLRLLRFIIPEGKRVLEVGCADGHVLRELRPSFGLGVDFSSRMVELAERNTPEDQRQSIRFVEADVESVTFTEKFDYILLSDLLGNLLDIQQALENLRSACHEETRVVINYHSILWEPFLRAAARIGLKMPSSHQNWISPSDITNFLGLTDYAVVKHQTRLLAPVWVPLLSWFLNRVVARLPLLNALCLTNIVVARIEDEIVDGHSTDGTVQEIEDVLQQFPDRNIKLLHQEGTGKGDAVRLGFAEATGDVLMILDADLTVPPEDLPKFYSAIARGTGEFINGSRLVYPLEKQAMRFLNILGNKVFSVLLSWVLGQPLKDTLCGTKVISRADYERIAEGRALFGKLDPFGDFDLLYGATKLNLQIVEIPVRYRSRTYGATRIARFRHGWLLLKMTVAGLWRFV
jgi:SAM-dependent methyltransferase